MFIPPPPIPNIESFSQSTISSPGSRYFGKHRYDVNIKQWTTLEVANKETFLSDNEELDPPPTQDIYIVFVAADLSYRSSSHWANI